jgi:hypothetical protein
MPNVREGDAGLLDLVCSVCRHRFLRSKVSDFQTHEGSTDICMSCYVFSALGEYCDVLIMRSGNSLLAAENDPARFVIAARSESSRYWFALTREGTAKVLPPDTRFERC